MLLLRGDRLPLPLAEQRQAEHQDLALAGRSESRIVAFVAVDRGETPVIFAADLASAAEHQIDGAAISLVAGAGIELHESCLRAPLGEHAHQLVMDARRS